jgi:hypothetical protein
VHSGDLGATTTSSPPNYDKITGIPRMSGIPVRILAAA